MTNSAIDDLFIGHWSFEIGHSISSRTFRLQLSLRSDNLLRFVPLARITFKEFYYGTR